MEVVGIFAQIEISNEKFHQFCHKHGEDLVVDTAYILKNKELEFKGEKPCLHFEYYHHPNNQLIIRYDRDTSSLFYLYFLELRSPEAMQVVPSFLILKNIVEYMTDGQIGYAAFSSSAPHFLTDPIWIGYKFEKGSCAEISPDQIPDSVKKELSQKSFVYYFNLIVDFYNGGKEPNYPKDFLEPEIFSYLKKI